MFNHSTLEQDIECLSREISEKKNLPEYKGLSEKEIIKQSIKPLIKKTDDQVQPAGGPSVPTAGDEESVLPDYLKDSPKEVRLEVEKLIDKVFHDGLEKAVTQAKKSTPFLLDAFHDALSDKLYKELKKRKLI